jgi:hypothetical protein
VITKVDTALITAMKQEIIRRDLRRKDLPSATGISTDVACRWIGIGSPSPILPGLHQAGNVACLLAGEHAGVTDIKATMRWVLEELGERDVSEAGLLILWHLSQLHQSVRWLRTVCQRDNFTIDGLIRIGIASPATCERVAHALKLDSLAQADLYAKVNTPKRDEKRGRRPLNEIAIYDVLRRSGPGKPPKSECLRLRSACWSLAGVSKRREGAQPNHVE